MSECVEELGLRWFSLTKLLRAVHDQPGFKKTSQRSCLLYTMAFLLLPLIFKGNLTCSEILGDYVDHSIIPS